MNSPSEDLKAMANAPKSNLQAILIEWGLLLNKLKIVCDFGTSAPSLAEAVKVQLYTNLGKDEVYCLSLVCTTSEFLGGEIDDMVPVQFLDNNCARIGSEVNFLGKPCGLEGTWEEVARKLFEMQNRMFAQLPEVPGDLKK